MLKETSLSVARREPQEHLVVRASRKAELSVAAQFENWLLNNNYRCTAPSLSSGKIESLKVKIVPNKFCVCRSDVSELGVQITLVVFFKPFFKRFS